LALTSISYFLVIASIRLILTLTDTSHVFYWNGNIRTGYEFFMYIAVLGIYLLSANLCQVVIINNFTLESKAPGQLILFFIVIPSTYVWLYLKNVLIFVTGMLRMRFGVFYEDKEIMNLGVSEKFAEISSLIIYLVVIVLLVVWLIIVLNRERLKFTKVVSKC